MDAIVLAGGKASPGDPLFAEADGVPKSLIPIAGKPMVQWVLDALCGAASIDFIVVVGLQPDNSFRITRPHAFLPDAGSLLANIHQAAQFLEELHPDQSHMVSLSADIPAVTSEMIEECIRRYDSPDIDIYYSVVSKQTMEERYPGSKRTYVNLKDVQVCGGDVNCFKKKSALNPASTWGDLILTRKNPIKQAAIIGFGTLFRLYTGQLTLQQAADRVCRKLGVKGKALVLPYAEIGMDVDKPFQLKIVEKDLLR